jgi:NDP-sugar pyrophosphorylase family protein
MQLHMLDNTEVDNDMSWGSQKLIYYCKEKGHDYGSNHKCLVEWNDINKNKSWVNVNNFALSLSNPKPIISFARNNNILKRCIFATSFSTVDQTRHS